MYCTPLVGDGSLSMPLPLECIAWTLTETAVHRHLCRSILHYDRNHCCDKSLLCHTNYGLYHGPQHLCLLFGRMKMDLAVRKLVTPP